MNKEEVKEDVSESNLGVIKNFVESPTAQLQAKSVAEDFLKASKGRWFTLSSVFKKFKKITMEELDRKVTLLQMFGLALRKIDTEKGTNETLYKIVITPKSKLLELDTMIAFHKARVITLLLEKDKVLEQIEQHSSNSPS